MTLRSSGVGRLGGVPVLMGAMQVAGGGAELDVLLDGHGQGEEREADERSAEQDSSVGEITAGANRMEDEKNTRREKQECQGDPKGANLFHATQPSYEPRKPALGTDHSISVV